jgi:hypothetical protein
MSENEVMNVDPTTGARKAGNDERYSLIPVRPLRQLVDWYESPMAGAPASIDDLYHHLWVFWGGQDDEPITGLPHVIGAAYHCFGIVDGFEGADAWDSPGPGFVRIPQEPLRLLAKHYGIGAKKYADRNWEKGYKWSLTFDAANRHLRQHVTGEEIDAETGTPHLICTAWHCLALAEYMRTHRELDDRANLPIPITSGLVLNQ